MDWQPIETAPKDGTEIMLFFVLLNNRIGHPGRPILAHWSDAVTSRAIDGDYSNMDETPGWMFSCGSFSDLGEMVTNIGLGRTDDTFIQPTHWMPLPDPPRQFPRH